MEGKDRMDWIENIDWERLRDPDPMFKLFKPEDPNSPVDPFYLKVSKLQTLLMKRPLWLSDEYRTPVAISSIITSYFSGFTFNVFYEVGDYQALVGFVNIQPEFKCELTLKLIDANIWGADFVRASKELIGLFIEQFRLKRITMETADRRIMKMAEMVGFKYEGERPNAFKWEGKFYIKYMLGKYGE